MPLKYSVYMLNTSAMKLPFSQSSGFEIDCVETATFYTISIFWIAKNCCCWCCGFGGGVGGGCDLTWWKF